MTAGIVVTVVDSFDHIIDNTVDVELLGSTTRGPSGVINTDGDVGDREFVGTINPTVGGAVPIPGDIWITDPPYGTTGNRPSAVTWGIGGVWYDTTLSKPIWSNGTVWRDAAGNTV